MIIKIEFSRTITFIIWVLLSMVFIPAQAQDEGLVAEWHFDEGIGNILTDSSGNGNDGVIHGAIWVDGKFGKVLNFNGEDDYISQTSLFNSVENTFTTESWVYPVSDHEIDSESSSGTSGTSGQRYTIWPLQGDRSYGANHAGTGLSVGTNGISVYEHAAHYMPALIVYSGTISGWNHIVVVYEDKKIKLYLNGNLIGTGSSPKKYIHPSGQIGGGDYGYYSGLIDEVRIYDRALSADEIKEQYGQGPIGLSITKIATPISIKQGQTSTVTVSVKNTGSTEISDIEIVDTIPKDITLIDGETSKTYTSISPKDTRSFQYVIQINEAGTFNLEPTTVSYADNKGNYQTVKSKPISIEVIPSLIEDSRQTPSKKSNNNVQSASVNLHGEKTDVMFGEDVLLKLSAVNIIGNPIMHVQVIIIPPNGWSVTSSEFSKSTAGQYVTIYDLKPEDGSRDIEIKIVPNQIGENFEVKGRIIYYFGDDISTREDHPLNLSIKVREKVDKLTPIQQSTPQPTTPGFVAEMAIIGILLMALFIRKRC